MPIDPSPTQSDSVSGKRCKILSLDGGGSKGVYTLGILKEVEAHIGGPLCDRFDLIYGTSTGAIIAALLARGERVATVERLYRDLVPRVMRHRSRRTRSAALRREADIVFGDSKFDCFRTGVGLVATNLAMQRPFVFKAYARQAFGLAPTFVPGYGCTIADAIMASTAAFPFFERVSVTTANQEVVDLIDGGFAANNPTLFAIADAVGALAVPPRDVDVLSLGVGHYREPRKTWYARWIFGLEHVQTVTRCFAVSTNTIEILRQLMFGAVSCLRIDDSFPAPDYETDLLESDPAKLEKLFALGRESFRKNEAAFLRSWTSQH